MFNILLDEVFVSIWKRPSSMEWRRRNNLRYMREKVQSCEIKGKKCKSLFQELLQKIKKSKIRKRKSLALEGWSSSFLYMGKRLQRFEDRNNEARFKQMHKMWLNTEFRSSSYPSLQRRRKEYSGEFNNSMQKMSCSKTPQSLVEVIL